MIGDHKAAREPFEGTAGDLFHRSIDLLQVNQLGEAIRAFNLDYFDYKFSNIRVKIFKRRFCAQIVESFVNLVEEVTCGACVRRYCANCDCASFENLWRNQLAENCMVLCPCCVTYHESNRD